MVLNRKGLNDFICELQGEVDFEGGYVILNTGEREVNGIWIFEEEEGSTRGVREECVRVLRGCVGVGGEKGGG